MAESVASQMEKILDEYSEDVKQASRKGTKKAAADTAKTLRSTSPSETGDYASGWTSKALDDDTFVTYNRKMPGLAHLLENGHVIRNKKGEFGRAPAHKHIAPAAEQGEQELVEIIERALQ